MPFTGAAVGACCLRDFDHQRRLTMRHSPSSAVFGVSELCISIIDLLCDSASDLKSCALVSRDFTFPAQSHLFRVVDLDLNVRISHRTHITFRGSRLQTLTHYSDGSERRKKAAARLHQLMDGAPHFRPLVRIVHAPIDETVLTHVLNMRLTRLTHLSLKGPLPYTDALYAMRDLIALPSIQWLTLCTSFLRDGLDLLLSHRTTPLRTLEIFPLYQSVDHTEYNKIRRLEMRLLNWDHTDARPWHSSAGSDQGIRISNLFLYQLASEPTGWLLDEDSPLDLSQLRSVQTYDCPISPVLTLPRSARRTVEEFRLNAELISHHRPLAGFAALKTLRLIGTPPALLAALETLPPRSDHLEVITLAARDYFRIDIAVLAPLDALLDRPHLPALTRVEVSVGPFHPERVHQNISHSTRMGAETDYDDSAFVSAFSAMHARGVLVVHDVGEWGAELAGRERFMIYI
ncbi:hypothetical protein DFH08DRAFT_900866 [Mycena albidolilacea]|uniref:Uncharacterized protein n=1 Tax=Mycena albidolilacea TaxID=1033008 RepID=A0AAD7EAM1_9AGAR|nr:hypothetical protein DFH08DRAFT_900866 [Mycena albidolilacea]